MIRIMRIAAVLALSVFSTLAVAGDDPLATRQNMMKAVGAAADAADKMLKGQEPYDPVKAGLAMRTLYAVATGYKFYFPAPPAAGQKSSAAPKIWEDKAGFEAAVAKFEQDSYDGVDPAGKGLDAFRAAFGKVGQNCGSCHRNYRVRQ